MVRVGRQHVCFLGFIAPLSVAMFGVMVQIHVLKKSLAGFLASNRSEPSSFTRADWIHQLVGVVLYKSFRSEIRIKTTIWIESSLLSFLVFDRFSSSLIVF